MQLQNSKAQGPVPCAFLHVFEYQLWDSNPHSVELDFESSASTNSAKLASSERRCRIKQEKRESVKRNAASIGFKARENIPIPRLSHNACGASHLYSHRYDSPLRFPLFHVHTQHHVICTS